MAPEVELTAQQKREEERKEERLKQKKERAKELAEEDSRKPWKELLEEPRRAAALVNLQLDRLLEGYYNRITTQDPDDTLASRSEETDPEIRGATPPERQDLERAPSSSLDLSVGTADEQNQPLLLRSDKPRDHSDEPGPQSLQVKLQKLFKTAETERARKELENKLLKEAPKIEKEKRDLLEAEIAPESVVAEVHLRYLLQVLDQKELDAVYERRIKDERRLIEKLDAGEEIPEEGIKKKGKARGTVEWRGTGEDDVKYVDSRIGVPKLPESYTEIKRLLDIENNPVYVKALQEWSRKEALFSNRVERKKKIVSNLKNEIYQLIGFFSVFQGVILTAVAQSSLLHCRNLWSPISLSVLASAASISGVVHKLMQIQSFQTTIDLEDRTLKVCLPAESRTIMFSNWFTSTGILIKHPISTRLVANAGCDYVYQNMRGLS